jgi:subtilase family serine protease
VATARRLTLACVQPDPRPDLRVRSVDVIPGEDPGSRTYLVTVRNAGRSPAADFDVVLAVDGAPRPPVTVAGLAAGAAKTVSIAGPRCGVGGSLLVTVDPDDRVDESLEGNDQRTFPCL